MLRALVAGLLIAVLTACTSWSQVSMSPVNYIRSHDPAAVWLQLEDGSTMVLGRPRVMGDTLRGIASGVYRNVPLSHVTKFKAQEPSKTKTGLLIAGGVLFAAGIVWVATSSDHTTP